MLALPSEIFNSYTIDFMEPFTKLKNYDTVLVVVNRAVGYSWLIPTTMKATAVNTMEQLQNYIFTPHGVPTSIVSDAYPRFTSPLWKQTVKPMGIELIMTTPGYNQPNGQAGHKIRELKTALRTVINRLQTTGLFLYHSWHLTPMLLTQKPSTCDHIRQYMGETILCLALIRPQQQQCLPQPITTTETTNFQIGPIKPASCSESGLQQQ